MNNIKWLMAVSLVFIVGSANAEETHTQSAVKHTEKAVESDKRGEVSKAIEHTKSAEDQAAAAEKSKAEASKAVSTGHAKNKQDKKTGKKKESTE